MSEKFNINDTKSRLLQLAERTEAGEEIIIARDRRPEARPVPFRTTGVKRKAGRMRGHVRIADDFDAPLPATMFEGE